MGGRGVIGAPALGNERIDAMTPRHALLLAAFLCGYVAHDATDALGGWPASPAAASGNDFRAAVVQIIETCDVYVYDVSDQEGWGEITC